MFWGSGSVPRTLPDLGAIVREVLYSSFPLMGLLLVFCINIKLKRSNFHTKRFLSEENHLVFMCLINMDNANELENALYLNFTYHLLCKVSYCNRGMWGRNHVK